MQLFLFCFRCSRTPTEDDKSNADYPFKEEDAVFEFCEG